MQIRPSAAMLFFLLGAVLAMFFLYTGDEDAELTWTMVNVSGNKHSGDAHLLEFPDGRVVIIDTGYRYYTEHYLVPLLRSKGITRIHALVITHAHRNHYGGIGELIKADIMPDVVYFNQPPKQRCDAETWSTGCDYGHVQATFGMLEENEVPVKPLSQGDNIVITKNERISLDVLYAFDGMDTPVGRTDINDTSAILKLRVGDQSVLFAADLNRKIGAHLARHGENLRADIMTAPHHGVESAAPDVFFDAVQPRTILASVSAPPHLGPRGKRLRDYAERNDIPLYVSGLHGNVVVKINQDDFTVHPGRLPAQAAASSKPEVMLRTTHAGRLDHPAHVVRFRDFYIAAELFNERLAVADGEDFSNTVYVDKTKTGTSLRSPHFIAPSNEPGIFFSEGWGSGIIHIPNAEHAEITRYPGPSNQRFNAPHGVCQAKDGWVYVADSLNSRLVRYRQPGGSPFEVFADHDRQVGYGRQILCRDDGVWLSNSYEKKEGINPGEGSNVLRITDFDSGKAEVMVTFRRANMTGIGIIEDRWLLVGLWSDTMQTLMVDLQGREKMSRLPRPDTIPGPPYGITVDEDMKEIFISYPGDILNKTDPGGYAVYSYAVD